MALSSIEQVTTRYRNEVIWLYTSHPRQWGPLAAALDLCSHRLLYSDTLVVTCPQVRWLAPGMVR